MIIGILSLFLLCFLEGSRATGSVIPEWNCWFNTYSTTGGERTRNLLFSYNNTLQSEVIIATSSEENHLEPSLFNGQQPNIFKVGYNMYALLLRNVTATQLIWQLDNVTLTVNLSELTRETRCDVKYKGICPMSTGLEHFCEDDSYCNGEETCFPPVIFGLMTARTIGVCTRPSQGVICGPSANCNESTLSCLSTQAPPPPPPPILPIFHCWFYTQDSQDKMSVNLMMSYNNTAPSVVSRPYDTDNNSITPSIYDGAQPSLFYSGLQENVFIIKDLLNILDTAEGIVWRLTTESLHITVANITLATKCPPTPTEPQEPLISSPTSAPSEGQCSEENPDCSKYDSFCMGVTHCDTASSLCVLNSPSYSPCPPTFVASAQISCVEHLSICIASVLCSTDQECNDGLICNGMESCVNGTCVIQSNLTILELCGTVDAICVEGRGCVAINQTLEDKYIVAIVGGIALVIIILLILFSLFFYSKLKASKAKRK
jgi:hypothetical protein